MSTRVTSSGYDLPQSDREALVAEIVAAGRVSRAAAGRIAAWLDGRSGPIEHQVRADIAALGPLDGARASYAEVAYRLARALDADSEEGATGLSGAARELRAALTEVWKGVRVERQGDRDIAAMGQPVG